MQRTAVAWAQVVHGRRALARLSANFYKRPAERIANTGITGTNGKSTTAFLIESIFQAAGRKTALVGTIEYHVAGKILPAPHTTPEALELNRLLSEGLGLGVTEAVMEVSSHAVEQQRVFGIPFDVAVFTNLTRDHLDYHGTMENYFRAKQAIFEGCGTEPPRAAVLNLDDEYGRQLWKLCKKKSALAISYGLTSGDFHAESVEITPRGSRFQMVTPSGKIAMWSPLIGNVNVYNVLAASAAGYARDCSAEAIAKGIFNLTCVPGRFERVDCGQPFTVVVDYAHTDDALRNLTALARDLVVRAGLKGKVITLFGCGGDRDRAKRPLMGEAAGKGSDFVVLTSDNPRSEETLAIMNDALVGLQKSGAKYFMEPDRRKAIAFALQQATPPRGQGPRKSAGYKRGNHSVRRCRHRARVSERHRLRLQGCRESGHRGKDHMKLLLSRIAEFIAPAGSAATGQYDGDAMTQGYSIDSRTVQPGELFFAVKGERLDGHDFVEQALSRGAIAAVVRKDQRTRYSTSAGLLAVADTLAALQTLATAVRKIWGKTAIGVTGSMGKTTTKEAMAHLLAIQYRVHRTKGNFNNHFGLPLGLLTLEPEYDLAVVEMGMSHPGEISALARIALPNQAVITNVAPVHLESFDSIAGIARAKYELIEALPHGGTAVLNADDEYVCQFGRDFKGKVVMFGLKPTACVPADVRAENVEVLGPEGTRFDLVSHEVRQSVQSPLLGKHNVYNVLAAAAIAIEHGITPSEIAAGRQARTGRPTGQHHGALRLLQFKSEGAYGCRRHSRRHARPSPDCSRR